MTAGEVAGLIAAGAFAVLVLLAAVPLLKLGRLLDEARFTLHDLGKDVEPILTETASTISRANREIDKIDGVTTTLAHMT